jgi:hypothetical protein
MSMRIGNQVQMSWNEVYNSASQLRKLLGKLRSCVEALEEIDGLEELALGNDIMAVHFFELAQFVAAECAVRWPRVERILDMRLRAFSNQMLSI